MKLKKFIIHELIKEPHRKETKVNLSDEMMTINSETTNLIETLLKSYRGNKLVYANFEDKTTKFFPTEYLKYTKSIKSDNEFIEFTKKITINLETIVKSVPLSKGGYLFYVEYEMNSANFNAVFLMRDVSGRTLNKTTKSFKIEKIEYLDTSHLAMACRINTTKLREDNENYITFTRQKQKEVSDYFINWINVTVLGSTTEYTNELYNIINELPRPINKNTNLEFTIDEIRSMVYDHALASPNKLINLNLLSEQIYGNSETISTFVDEHQITIDTEFRFDSTALKKFVQINLNIDGISLKFSKGDFGKKVKLSLEKDDVVLITSKDLANALKLEKNDI